MMFHLLRSLLFVASILIIGVGLSILTVGPQVTAALTLQSFSPLLNTPAPVSGFQTANVDSELRFFAPFFIAYGTLVFLCAKHLRTHLYYVPHLLSVFFIGGLARLLSHYAVGPTHIMFYYLMVIEIAVPVVLYFIYMRVVIGMR